MGEAIGAPAAAAITSASDIATTQMTNDANAAQAQKAMDFSERMSSTAYQRSTEDMKKAGINPMMAYMQGGASSPPGQAASMQAPNVGRVAEAAISTALDQKRTNAEATEKEASANLMNLQAATEAQNSLRVKYEAERSAIEAKLAKKTMSSVEAKAQLQKLQSEFDAGMVKWDGWMKRAGEAIGTIGDGIGKASRGIFGVKNQTSGKQPQRPVSATGGIIK